MNARPLPFRSAAFSDERYARHTLIDGWDQDRLASLKVAVFGVGALGNEVIKNLALLGAGHLLLVDMDRIESSNLSRSVLFRAEDTGQAKAEVAARRARELNPALEVKVIIADLNQAIGPGRLEGFDLAIACLDSVDARLGVDRLCRRAGIPWWNGGLGASACEITRFSPDDGPCYACTLTSRSLAREASRWSCQDAGRMALPPRTLPTTATAAALGGAMLVQDAVASVMPEWRSRATRPGTRHLLEASPFRLTSFEVPRNPSCPFHQAESPPERVSLDHRSTGRALLRETGSNAQATEIHLGFDLVLSWQCECPGGVRPLLPARAVQARCPACGTRPRELEAAASLPGSHEVFDLPLTRLGIPDGGEILLYEGGVARTVRFALCQPE
jgi:adenylyltransferase/sulfurtransferase